MYAFACIQQFIYFGFFQTSGPNNEVHGSLDEGGAMEKGIAEETVLTVEADITKTPPSQLPLVIEAPNQFPTESRHSNDESTL